MKVRLKLSCRTLPDVESASVAADLKGREKPEEVVLIGAHLDSWDLGTGAIDDGAGVAIDTAADTLDKVDPVEFAQNAATMAVMACVLADMPEPLPRAAAQ